MKKDHSCPNMARPSQPRFNPPPGSSAVAATAPKEDIKKRENTEPGPIRSLVNKMIEAATPKPSPTPSPGSYQLKDKKDQFKDTQGGNF